MHALRQEALLAPGGGAATQSSTSNNLVAAQGIVCYLCGRSTPSSGSFGWHLRACVTRWQVAEFAKPPNQRRPLPKLPRHVKLPGPKPKLLLASTSSTLSSSTAAAARNPRQPLLPKGSSESRAAAFAAAMSKWQAQVTLDLICYSLWRKVRKVTAFEYFVRDLSAWTLYIHSLESCFFIPPLLIF